MRVRRGGGAKRARFQACRPGRWSRLYRTPGSNAGGERYGNHEMCIQRIEAFPRSHYNSCCLGGIANGPECWVTRGDAFDDYVSGPL
jgi:hypothetical protein